MSLYDKIADWSHAKERVESWKNEGDKIVFTNGCFDLLHVGHVDYMEKARNLGDKLIVAVNSDNSIKRLKGVGRPITDINSRSKVLAALGFVDLVVVFDEDTPLELISELIPDILVKGNDYLAENVVGADIVIKNGGEVVTLELIKGYSTTSIIERIKK